MANEDEFDDMDGWQDLTNNKNPVKESAAPEGKSIHSRIEEDPDDEDEEEEGEEEEESEEDDEDLVPAAKSKKGKSEGIDYERLAEQIAAKQRPQAPIPQVQTQRPQGDALDVALQKLRAQGADPLALSGLLEVVDGVTQRRAQDDEQIRRVQEFNRFHQSIDEMFDSAIDSATSLSPKLSRLKESITQAVLQEWRKKEYDGERAKIQNGKKPDTRLVAQAVAKVRDRFAKDYGLQTVKAPTQIRSKSKPAATKGGSIKDQINRLDGAQRAYFDVFRKELGDERALKSAKKVKQA